MVIKDNELKKWLVEKKGMSITNSEKLINEMNYNWLDQETENLIQEFKTYRYTFNEEPITFKTTVPIKKELQRIAKDNNMKLSEIIRSAIYDFIDNYNNFERRLSNEKRNREEINRQRNIQKNSSKHKKD